MTDWENNNLLHLFAIHTDQDTLSEREFACPVKRRRQNEFDNGTTNADNHIQDVVVLRHPHKSQLLTANNANDVEFKFRIDFSDATDTMCKRFVASLTLIENAFNTGPPLTRPGSASRTPTISSSTRTRCPSVRSAAPRR